MVALVIVVEAVIVVVVNVVAHAVLLRTDGLLECAKGSDIIGVFSIALHLCSRMTGEFEDRWRGCPEEHHYYLIVHLGLRSGDSIYCEGQNECMEKHRCYFNATFNSTCIHLL